MGAVYECKGNRETVSVKRISLLNGEVYRQAWHERAERYAEDGTLSTMVQTELFTLSWELTINLILDKLALRDGDQVLDAGCGWGRVLVGIKHRVPGVAIDGIDIAEELVAQAGRLIARFHYDDAHVHLGDILELGMFGKCHFDAVYSTRVMHYVVAKEEALIELHRVLRPGGRIVIVIPNRFCPYRWITYGKPLYSIYRMKDLMERVGFWDVRTGSYGFFPPALSTLRPYPILRQLDQFFRQVPGIKMLGGLTFVVGKKRDAEPAL